MVNGLDESTTKTADETFAASSSDATTNNNNNEAGDFECNICLDLAQDPIVTLCGHLFCWPCLYKWLHYHSKSHECPVCKALVLEDKLVPLYGRGKSSSDPRTRPIPGLEIPNRPSGQRPDTAPPLGGPGVGQRYLPNFGNFGFGLLGGFMPMTTARFGNLTMSTGFGGLFPAMLNFQFNGFPDSPTYGGAHADGFRNGFQEPVHNHGEHHGHSRVHQTHLQDSSQHQDVILKNLLVIIGFLVLVSFIFT